MTTDNKVKKFLKGFPAKEDLRGLFVKRIVWYLC